MSPRGGARDPSPEPLLAQSRPRIQAPLPIGGVRSLSPHLPVRPAEGGGRGLGKLLSLYPSVALRSCQAVGRRCWAARCQFPPGTKPYREPGRTEGRRDAAFPKEAPVLGLGALDSAPCARRETQLAQGFASGLLLLTGPHSPSVEMESLPRRDATSGAQSPAFPVAVPAPGKEPSCPDFALAHGQRAQPATPFCSPPGCSPSAVGEHRWARRRPRTCWKKGSDGLASKFLC